jgi:hypothetical protein
MHVMCGPKNFHPAGSSNGWMTKSVNTRLGAPARTTIQAVPKSPQLGIKSYSLWYKASQHTPQGTQPHACTSLPR